MKYPLSAPSFRGPGQSAPASHRKRAGFTLIEMMLSTAIIMVMVGLFFIAYITVFRVVAAEESVLGLDVNSDRIIWEISRQLPSSMIPIRVDGVAADTTLGKVFNNNAKGFGRYGNAWRQALRHGTDCLAFMMPVDFDGDGDTIDSDGLPELGIILPPGGNGVAAAEYSFTGADKHNHLKGNLHPYLSQLNPTLDLGLTSAKGTLDLTAPRFQEAYTFPAAADRAYGIIRFVPKYDENNDPVIVNEATLKYDLNEDGTMTDTFALGYIEMLYPNVTRAVDVKTGSDVWTERGAPIRRRITESMVLLQINQTEDSWEPIFKLARYKLGAAADNSAVYDDSDNADGVYAIRLRLLMYDPSYVSRGGTAQLHMSRKYETLITLRGMP